MRNYVFAGLLLSALMLSACGRGTTTPPPPVDPYAPPPPVAGPGAYTPDENYRPVQNFDGQTLTIAALHTDNIPPAMAVANEPDPATSANYQRDRRMWDNARRVERDFNIIVEEFIERPVRMQNILRTSSLAGDAFADIVAAPPDMILAAALGEWIVPLDTIDLQGSDLLGTQLYTRFVAEGLGHSWAFDSSEPSSPAFTLGVNLDLIAAAGAPNPVDLFNAGQWTWDNMLYIMRAVNSDTHYGIAGMSYYILINFIGANDGILIDDNFRNSLHHPNTLEAMYFVKTIFQEELWHSDVYVHLQPTGWSSSRRYWFPTDGNAAFIAGADWFNTVQINDIDMPFEFAILPLPTGPSNTSGNTWLGGWNRQGLVLPNGSGWYPASLLAIMEEYFSWAGNDLEMISDIPVTWWHGVTLSGDNAHRQLDAMNHMGLDFGLNVPDFVNGLASGMSRIAGRFINLPDTGGHVWEIMTPLDAIEFFRSGMQHSLDAVFGR